MNNSETRLHIPARAMVDVGEQANDAIYPGRAWSHLLKLALAGVDVTLPATLGLVLEVARAVVECDRLLLLFEGERDGGRSQITRNFEAVGPPPLEANPLHAWVRQEPRPLLVERGMGCEMDAFLGRVEARAAAAVPVGMGAGWCGSLQLFRAGASGFSVREARTLWLLSLLAGAQINRLNALQHLTRMAYTDYLTGVRARGFFEQALEQEVHRANRQHTSLGLVLVDLDDFKQINDRFGHHGGDEVLRQFAQLLQRDMRDVDTVARFGGDEFALVLPGAGEEGVRHVVERLHQAVTQATFTVPGGDGGLRLSLSVGVALCPADECETGALLRAADAALYEAKTRGKNRPLFTREMRRAG